MARRQNIVSEISNDFLTCHICWETYRIPKTLPCGHFFCRDCLYRFCNSSPGQPNLPPIRASANLANDSCRLIHCPTCRKAVGEIPFEGDVTAFVDRLPDNFYVNSLQDLVDHHKSERGRSRSERGDDRTVDNGEDKNLQRSKSMSAGRISSTTGQPQGFQKSGVHLPCLEHPNENISLYCTTHAKVLCDTCRLLNHDQCSECLSIDGAEYRFIRPRVQHVLSLLNHRRQTLASSLRDYIRQQQTLTADSFAIEKRIDDTKRALDTKTQRCFSEAKDKFKQVVSEHEKALKECQESIKLKEAIMDESASNLEAVGRKGSALEMASFLSLFDSQFDLEPIQHNSEPEDQFLRKRIQLKANDAVGFLLTSEENIFGQIVLENFSDGQAETGVSQHTEDATPFPDQLDSPNDNLNQKVTEIDETVSTTTTNQADFERRENCSGVRSLCRAKESKEPFITITKKEDFTISTTGNVDVFALLKNGDIVGLKSSDKGVILCRRSGLVTDQVLLPTVPLGLSMCNDSKRKVSIAVTGFASKIYFLSSSPRLKLVRSIPTRSQYTGIAKIPKRLSMVAVAGYDWPPVIDLISLQGMVLKTFGSCEAGVQLFREPRHVATSSDFLFVPDGNNLKILCWDRECVQIVEGYQTQSGSDSQFKALKTACRLHDTVLVADCQTGKLHALCLQNGVWVHRTVLEQSFIGEGCTLTTGNNDTVLLSRGQSVQVYTVEYMLSKTQERTGSKSPRARGFSVDDQYLTF